MQQVWKCDFCSTTNLDKNFIAEHEASCSFNPSLRSCYTCKNLIDEGYGMDSFYVCKLDKNVFDVMEDKTPCDVWLIEPSKMKNKIKNF